MAKRKSPIKQMIDEALSEVEESGFPKDPAMDDERQLSGPERFVKGQKAKDEVIIDSLLADISGKEGYFLKLKKEMRPNEWMLMKTIETEWRNWPDIETAVANIVKEHTKTAPQKWGSGPYRIEYACKGGMRGKGYPAVDFYINAEEEFLNTNGANGTQSAMPLADATTQVTAQLDMLGRLTEIINSNKAPGLDPAKTQEQIAGAFQQGMSMKANEGNQSTQLMVTMMTGLMGMMTAMATNKPVEPKVVNPNEGLQGMLEVMKTFGVIGQPQQQEKPKSTIEFLTELKALGMDVFKKDDPLEQVGKLKQIASIASDFMGMGGTTERPSIIEKIVDALGPAIPGLLKDIKETAQSAVQVQVEAGRNIERARLQSPGVKPVTPIMQDTTMQTQTATGSTNVGGGAVNPQIAAFFNGLYESVRMNNRMFYPIIYTSLLQDPQGVALVDGIVKETHTAKELIEMLQGYGDPRFRDSEFVMKHLVSYVNGFIVWLRDMQKPRQYADSMQEAVATPMTPAQTNGNTPNTGYDVGCTVCGTEFVYGSAEEFAQEENKVCGSNGCIGIIHPLAKA